MTHTFVAVVAGIADTVQILKSRSATFAVRIHTSNWIRTREALASVQMTKTGKRFIVPFRRVPTISPARTANVQILIEKEFVEGGITVKVVFILLLQHQILREIQDNDVAGNADGFQDGSVSERAVSQVQPDRFIVFSVTAASANHL